MYVYLYYYCILGVLTCGFDSTVLFTISWYLAYFLIFRIDAFSSKFSLRWILIDLNRL